jgi:tetratricopeptide (TPR) repeat protein
MFRSQVLVAIVILACATSAIGGEAERARARTLYQSGTSHYNLSEFREALGDFKEAYRLLQDASFLFNIAQCYRQLGDPTSAASFYRAFRREAPDAPNRADVDRLIGEMDKAAAAQHGPPQETLPTSSAAPVAVPAPSLTNNVVTAAPPPRRPLTKRPWFWVTLGGAAVVIAGVTVAVVLGTAPHAPTPSLGHVNGN